MLLQINIVTNIFCKKSLGKQSYHLEPYFEALCATHCCWVNKSESTKN